MRGLRREWEMYEGECTWIRPKVLIASMDVRSLPSNLVTLKNKNGHHSMALEPKQANFTLARTGPSPIYIYFIH